MKILKLKPSFFSLLAIAMVTVFLSSCEKDIIDKSATNSEVINEIFQLASKQIDFSKDEETEISVILTQDDLSPLVLKAMKERGLNLSQDFVIQNSRELFCSSIGDCQINGDLVVKANSNMITERGCVTVCLPVGLIRVCVTICIDIE